MTSKQHIAVGLFVGISVSALWYILLVVADSLGLPARALSDASVYFTTATWVFMAAGALAECELERRQDAKELARAYSLKLDILIRSATSNHERALLMEAQGVMKLVVGLVAGYLLYKIGPSPDYSPVQMALRVFFMLDIYYFWMTKRKDRARRRHIPIDPLLASKNEAAQESAEQIERARDEVTAEIRENRRVFSEFGEIVLAEIEEIQRKLER